MKIKHIWSLFTGLSILLLIFYLNSASISKASETVVSLIPPSQLCPEAGNEVTVDIYIQNALNITGLQTDLVYDPAVLKYKSVRGGGGIFTNPLLAPPKVESGRLKQIAIVQMPEPPTVSGDSAVITVVFEVLSKQASELILENVQVADANHDPIAGVVVQPKAVITVEAPPVAAFTADKTTAGIGESIQFTDQSTNGPTSWEWNFGDAGVSDLQNPAHIYTALGQYNVSLIAHNGFGDSAPVTKVITIAITALTITADPSQLFAKSNEQSTLTINVSSFQTPVDIPIEDISLIIEQGGGALSAVSKIVGQTGNYTAAYTADSSTAPATTAKIKVMAQGKAATVDIQLLEPPKVAEIKINPALTLEPQKSKDFTIYIHANLDCEPANPGDPTVIFLKSLVLKAALADPQSILVFPNQQGIWSPSGLALKNYQVSQYPLPAAPDTHCQITIGGVLNLTATAKIGTADLTLKIEEEASEIYSQPFPVNVAVLGALANIALTSDYNQKEMPGYGSSASLTVKTTDTDGQSFEVIEPQTAITFYDQAVPLAPAGISYVSTPQKGEYKFTYTPQAGDNNWKTLTITAHIENRTSNEIIINLIKKNSSQVNSVKLTVDKTNVKPGDTIQLTLKTYQDQNKIVLDQATDLILTAIFQPLAMQDHRMRQFLVKPVLAAVGEIPIQSTGELGVYQATYTAPGVAGQVTFAVNIPKAAGVTLIAPTITVTAPQSSGPGMVGTPCSKDSDCKTDAGLECHESTNKCIPTEPNRKIGTWCSQVYHCKKNDSAMALTCNEQEDYCVGGVPNVSCLNNAVNKGPNDFGFIDATQLDSTERCDTGLYCDPNKGSCQNDFGQGKIPADKLGETAEDIRDQIRNIINIAFGFLGVAGVIVVIYGGAIWLSAAGDDEKVGKAKKTIIAGMIGLVIIGVAWTIVSYVLTVTQDIA